MTAFSLGLASFPLLLVLLALRLPIGVAMLVVGGGGYMLVNGETALLNYLKTTPYYLFANYSFSVIPLFLLMGQFATRAGLSESLFRAAYVFLGHRRGGLAIAGIGGCAGFGAICGSSTATASTMGQVALPEMRRYGYSGALSTGTLAAGGTLGILIPPSVILVIYAILTEQNVAAMFLAAFVPAMLAILGFMLAVSVYVRLFPGEGPSAPKASWKERGRTLLTIWPALAIFLAVIGGIYGGVFTPTEAAAVGAVATGFLALLKGGLANGGWKEVLQGTAQTTAMIFLILLGAEVYSAFLAMTRMPMEAASWITAAELSPYLVIGGILLFYLLLGCVMDSLSMILLTIPILFPIVSGLDFGLTYEETAIWFGILTVIVVELGLITPPVGLNVFVINAMAKDVPMLETFRGVLPFLIAEVVRVVLLVAFPGIVLFALRFA
ncbi:TRAP transporter large permease [Fodinicurvata sediminis]|uniref:TRAP transporter large permease n=1 Tax=Fodinicurvata sediminis TaxID=1121832 RepID=UPI0003B68F00|nr:TRAP transporter large permease [Fodinicurvata sediminis]